MSKGSLPQKKHISLVILNLSRAARVFSEKLIRTLKVNTFHASHTTRFISLFTKAAHLNLYWATSNCPAPCSRPVSGLSVHLRISVPNAVLPGFPTEILYAFIIPGSFFHDRNDFPTQITRKTTLKMEAERPTQTPVGIYKSAVRQNTVLKNFKSHNGNVQQNCEVTGPFGWESQ